MRRGGLRALELFLLLVGVAGLLVTIHSWFDARRAEREARVAFERALELPPIETRGGENAGPEAGSVLGVLEIPRLELAVAVHAGTLGAQLERGVGTIEGTRIEANLGIAGHRDRFFRPLRHIEKGDLIRLRTVDQVREYTVTGTSVVEPTRVDVLDPTPEPALTLVTCYPFFFVGHAPKRFIVRAEQVGPGGPAPAGLPATKPLDRGSM